MGITLIPNLVLETPSQFSGSSGSKTIGELRETGRYYRHPDSALISYPLVVEKPLGSIDKPLRIAVIGGGVAGGAAIYELSRLPNAKENLNVTLFESDPEHFTVSPKSSFFVDTFKKRAGRVFAAVTRDEGSIADSLDETKHAVYEIGAMRFPEIAGLTWHYANQVFDPESTVNIFPNPGTVPTEFVQGERVDRYVRGEWLDKNSPTKKLVAEIKDGLIGYGTDKKNISLFPIGGKDPAKISDELKSENTTKKRLEQIHQDWKTFAKKYDDLTLESAVKQIVLEKCDKLPNVPGLQTKDSKINHYVELFGRFGFGTGGFKAIYNTSLPDIMRLALWQYENEYTLPVKVNVQLVCELFDKAESNGLQIEVQHGRVCDICHLDESGATSAMVVYYPAVNGKGKEECAPRLEKFDYVIVAVPPKQASSIISRVGFKNVAREVILGDYKRQYPHPLNVRPAFVLSSTQNDADAVNSQIYTALKQVHMASSAKIFATIKKNEFDSYAPSFQGDKIKAIVSDCGLASSYIVPSPLQPESVSDELKYYTFLISYSWEDETKSLQNELFLYPKNVGRDCPENQSMIDKIINRTIRDVAEPATSSCSTTNGEPKDERRRFEKVLKSVLQWRRKQGFGGCCISSSEENPENPRLENQADATSVNPIVPHEKPEYKRWWFGDLLSKANSTGELTDVLSYDWTTNQSSGGFKLDLTGDYFNSNLLFRHHTHALQARALDNRFFLANCSYSHLGGWIEGALMSSVNAVCGLIVAANQGDVSKLSEEARVVMTSFEPVA